MILPLTNILDHLTFLIRRHANDSHPGTSQTEPRFQRPANTTKQPNDGQSNR